MAARPWDWPGRRSRRWRGSTGSASPPTRSRFRSAARRALRRAVLNDRDPLRRGVFVGTVSAARAVRFRALFLAECAERIFPPLVRQDPLLLDGEREAINQRLGHRALAVKRERAREEPLLFELLQQSASEFLTISWARRTNTTGAPKLPSPLLLRSIPGDDVGELASVEELYERGAIRKLPARLGRRRPRRVRRPRRRLVADDHGAGRVGLHAGPPRGGRGARRRPGNC